jgi:hypothetical protein
LPPVTVDSGVANNLIEKTLTPPVAPCRRRCLGFLQRRGSIINRTVEAPVPVATP